MSEITIISNPSALAVEDLVDEYEKISQFYCKMKKNAEKCEQEVFQLKRNLELSEKREMYLSQELESITEIHVRELADTKQKHNAGMHDMRTRLADIEQINSELENEIERIKGELPAIESGSKANGAFNCITEENEFILSKSRFEYLEKLENDQLQDIDELKAKLIESMQSLAQNETEFENMRDCFECSQENLRCKTEELDEKNQIIDSLQEKIIELNAELAEYKSGSNEPDKKGNSLFAEVDDQRQQMKQILAQQKQQYLKMKREHQEGQLKIRRLQRENADIHREVQQCSQMLQDANHHYKESLNNTIGFLEGEVSKLQEKLHLTEHRLVALAKENKITWLESMLEYCKKETGTLKDQLYVTRLQKCEAEGLYIESKEQAARWRFEALKSRCIIVDRETLLERNFIPFGPLAKIGNIVGQSYKDGAEEMPSISKEMPLTPLSTIELANSVTRNEKSCSESSNLECVLMKTNIPEELQSTPLATNTSNVNASDQRSARIRTEHLSAETIEDDFTIITEPELNKENHNAIGNTKSLVGGTGSTILPQFRPINTSSERMKALSQSIVELDTNEKKINSTAKSAQKNSLKSRPKVVVKHIVLNRE